MKLTVGIESLELDLQCVESEMNDTMMVFKQRRYKQLYTAKIQLIKCIEILKANET